MKRTILLSLVLAPCLLGTPVWACDKEGAPTIPNGKTASQEEMGAAQGAIKAYMVSANAYLECVDKAIKAASDREQKTQLNVSYNGTVDEMNTVAGNFNKAIKAFKKANK